MSHFTVSFLLALLIMLPTAQGEDTVSIVVSKKQQEKQDPKIAFALGDLKKALKATGYQITENGGEFEILVDFYRPGLGPQGFRIQKEGNRAVRVVGGDSLGAMYGILELAEMLTLGGGLKGIGEKARKPHIFRRGLKFNIPMDARGHSYDDTGTAAQANIPVMWSFDFWKNFLDALARNRYNVLTLWTTHPYPGIVKMDKYPGIGYDNVCVLKEPFTPKTSRHWDKLDVYNEENFRVVKEISLSEKIAFWRRVFNLAEARGIEIYFFHWNIFTFGARGKHVHGVG